MVYILTYNDNPIVVGHGRYNRAKVIFDNVEQTTSSHIKSFIVRCYHLFGSGKFERCIIECNSKEEARAIEHDLHQNYGGNDSALPDDIQEALYDGFASGSVSETLLRIAQLSSFSGISDLKRWKKDLIISSEILKPIFSKLQL